MSRIESGFVPLPKAEQEQPEDNIKIWLNLPDYVDQDRIGVNLTNIQRLSRWGGVRQVILIGDSEQPTSSAEKRIPTFEFTTSADKAKRVEQRQVRLKVDYNIAEIAARIAGQNDEAHQIANWTRELEKGIKLPIRKAGHENLLNGLGSADKGDWISMGVATVLVSLGYKLTLGIFGVTLTPATIILGSSVGAYANNRMNAYKRRKDNPAEVRFSLFPGYQIDRALALSVASRTRRVFKDIGSDKK